MGFSSSENQIRGGFLLFPASLRLEKGWWRGTVGLEKGSCWEAALRQSQAPWILRINACPHIFDGILSALEEPVHLVLFLLEAECWDRENPAR